MSYQKPIFIISSPRSGSTLMRLILDAHPNIAVPPPSWLYEIIFPYLYSYGDLSQENNFIALAEDVLETPMIKKWETGFTQASLVDLCRNNSFKAIYDVLHEWHAKKENKPRWGEKNPRDSFWVNEIKADYPDAQFLHILRDGRDVAIDLCSTPGMRPHSLYSAALLWNHFVKSIRENTASLSKEDYYEVGYEKLCAQPEKELVKICNFLGEDYDSAMLNHHDRDGAKKWSGIKAHEKAGRPITTDFCEMYKNRLPENDIGYLNGAIGQMLETCGYPLNMIAKELPNPTRAQIIEGDMVTAPFNDQYKEWHENRRRDRKKAGVYSDEDRDSLLRSLV